jgi:hypothetical protein
LQERQPGGAPFDLHLESLVLEQSLGVLALALDGFREHRGNRLQEVDVVLRERAGFAGEHPQHAPPGLPALDPDQHAAGRAVVR